MKEVVFWKAKDGRLFESKESCREYEEKKITLVDNVVKEYFLFCDFDGNVTVPDNKSTLAHTNLHDYIIVKKDFSSMEYNVLRQQCLCVPEYPGVWYYNMNNDEWINVKDEYELCSERLKRHEKILNIVRENKYLEG